MQKSKFCLQFTVAVYNLRILPTIGGFSYGATHFQNRLLFFCGFHELLWLAQTLFRTPQVLLHFDDVNDQRKVAALWIPQQSDRFLLCRGFRLHVAKGEAKFGLTICKIFN